MSVEVLPGVRGDEPRRVIAQLPGPLTLAIAGSAIVLAVVAAWHPVAVLGLLVVVAAIGVCSRYPTWALGAFLFSIPLEYGFEIGGSQSLTITKLAGGLCFVGFGLYAARTGLRLRFDRSHALMLGLLCIALGSSVLAESVSQGLSTTVRYASWFVLYIVITQFPRSDNALRVLTWTLVVSAGIAGAWGSWRFLAGRDLLATLPYNQPNDYAFVLASVLPLAIWLCLRERGIRRVLAWAIVGCLLAGIALSFSRTAWLAVAGSLLFYAVMNRRKAKILLPILAIGVAVTAGFVVTNPSQVEHGARAKQAVAQQNVDSRLTLYRGAVSLAESHPLLGVGPGNFGNYYYDITHAPIGTPALLVVHDTYLEVAAELGLIGFVMFMGFLVLVGQRVHHAIRENLGPADFAGFLQASFVAVLLGFLTVSEEFFAPVWIVGGLATWLWMERSSASST